MRRMLLALLTVVFAGGIAAPLMAQGAPPQGGADQPYTVEYYYKVPVGPSAGVSRAVSQEPLPTAEEDCGHGADALSED